MSNILKTRSQLMTATLSLFSGIVVGVISPIAGLTALAQDTTLPMKISLRDNNTFFLIVPDKDVNQIAFGGKLKRRDVHTAKMFEVTQHFCKTEPKRASSYEWIYQKNGGLASLPGTDRGTFRISCDLANDIAIAYGAGKPERTTVEYDPRFTPRTKTYSIPTLNIVGGKVDTWLSFMSNFKPVR